MVFLHHFGGDAGSWHWVASELQTEFRCIALDLPGFGHTSPLKQPSLKAYGDFVCQTLTHLEIDTFVLVGHSMGAKIALQVAASLQGERLQAVVLVTPSPPTQEPISYRERTRLLNYHSNQENAQITIDRAIQKPLTERRRSIAVRTHMNVAESAWCWWLLEGMNHSIADQMKHVRVPVTILASQDDPVIPYPIIQQEVMGVLPNAQLVEISGVGHLMPLEAPVLVATAIRRAIAPVA
ncbi:MAG: alpha/beta hydrolase [Leptolyngbya sp. SIO1E4]|nr:alpha/beta hydrolase [Leptolyngbya sp. SIO1E4]